MPNDGLCCLAAHANAKAPWTCQCECHKRSLDATREELSRRQREAYELIERELQDWKNEFENDDSEANLYGLCMVDAVYSIHQKLNEQGL